MHGGADRRHRHGSLISSNNATPPPFARSSPIVPPLLATMIPITVALHQDRFVVNGEVNLSFVDRYHI
uniref:Uncharacterized protein n=1 Tax=Oryza punctata TaxID=4537 RepID=A0A0E0LBQ8_ORYPU